MTKKQLSKKTIQKFENQPLKKAKYKLNLLIRICFYIKNLKNNYI